MLRSFWFSISGGLGWILTLADICIYRWPRHPQSNNLNKSELGPNPLDAEGDRPNRDPCRPSVLHCKLLPAFTCLCPQQFCFGGYLGYFSFNNFCAGSLLLLIQLEADNWNDFESPSSFAKASGAAPSCCRSCCLSAAKTCTRVALLGAFA